MLWSPIAGHNQAPNQSRRYTMSHDDKAREPQTRESGGLFRHMFGSGGHESPGPDAHSRPGTKTTLDLGDIQGFILRGYRMPMVRHFLLTVGVPAEARKLLGRFVSGDESDAPQITTAEDWHVGFEPGPGDKLADPPRRKPDYCLNLGITWQGLIALEIKDRVPTVSFKSFGAFVAGAAERAKLVGDSGASGPQNWVSAFGTGSDHVLVTLHAISPEAMTTYSDRLSALFAEGSAFREIWRADGMALTEMRDGKPVFTSRVHFGYTDGISMTTIRGGPERYPPDRQQSCEPWLFVLLDEAEITERVLLMQANAAAQQRQPLRRVTHAKGICARAQFEVFDVKVGRDPKLAARLARGIFATPGVYLAIVRL